MPEMQDSMAEATLTLAVGAAQRKVVGLLHGDLQDRIAALHALCTALGSLVAHQAVRAAPGLRGSVEMAINEFATLSDLLAATGDLHGASTWMTRGTALAERHGDAALLGRMAADHAFQLARAGAPAAALALLLKARDKLLAELQGPRGAGDAARADPYDDAAIDPWLKVQLALATFFRWLGDFERAGDLVVQLRTRLAATGATTGAVRALSNRLRATEVDNEAMMLAIDRAEQAPPADRGPSLDEAQAAWQTLQPVYDGLGPAAGAAMRFQASRILALRGERGAALAWLDALLPTFETTPALQQKCGMAHLHRARLLLDMGFGADALADAEQGVAGEERYAQNETRWKAHWQLARAREAASPADATAQLAAWDDAVTALDGIRTLTLGFRLDNLALRNARPMVDDAVACAAALGDGGRAARYADAVKSRFLDVALRRGRPPALEEGDWRRLDALSRDIDAAQAGRGRGPGERPVGTCIAERAELIERLRLRAGAGRPPAPGGVDIARTLAVVAERGQAALQMFLSGSTLTAVLLREGTIAVATRSLPPAVLSSLERYERNLLITPVDDQFADDFDPLAWQLSAEALWPPKLLAAALASESLLVCPHGRLNLLPWAAMPCAGARLFDHLPVATLPNLACIVPLAGRPLADGRAALFGDALVSHDSRRLPADEIDDLGELFGAARLVAPPFRREGASVASFRALLDHPQAEGAALHLNCHGSFDPDDPAGAALHLSDRSLTAAEIALRPLRFREVTMSACSTGLRPSRIGQVEMLGDDIVGLPASFLEAGATTVLSSITPAGPTASAALFAGFHRRRIAGVAPLSALRQTQQELARDRRFPITDWIGYSLISVH